MTGFSHTLQLRSSPHIHSGASVDTIMFNVVLALLPACGYAIYHFGLAALITIATGLVSCLVTEHLICWLRGQATTIADGSVTITGLLYAMTLPPGLPAWMTFAGGVVAVAMGKMLFGGLGANPFNPALVGRAFLQAAFPAAMTTWPSIPSDRMTQAPGAVFAWPLMQPVAPEAMVDGVSGATPLMRWKFEGALAETQDLFLGAVSGSTGETSALLILIGGAYLAARGMMNWRIPLAILATVAVVSGGLHGIIPERCAPPLFMLGSGGLMLGAVFMATDMVASPITHRGCVVYGILIGLLVVSIRVWGGMPEGVMYAILLGNAVSPLIDRWIQPQVYGTRPRRRTG
jgi:Na+-translocating ferredoxin:NAD+ oxidoreductase subunit D